MTLAEKISLLRRQKGWSQEELAEKMDISRQSVSKWESGQSIPDLDKIIKISDIFAVSTDYLLKEDKEENYADIEIKTCDMEETSRNVSMEEANEFMDLTQKLSYKMAAAIALFVLSPICLLLLGGMEEYGRIAISEDMAAGVGMVVLLIFVAIGVSIIVPAGMKLSKYEYLEKEKIFLQYGIEELVKERKKGFETSFQKSIVAGVILSIISVIPIFLAVAMNAEDLIYVYCLVLLLCLVACSAYLFVKSGMVQGSFEKLLQEGEYAVEKKEMNKKISFFATAYWCITVAIFLGISFYYDAWGRSWIIWPVAGVLFAGIQGILFGVLTARQRKAER
ncbi:MAG: helix-turn-helix transcriptional regulator [Lachnospiraceae bacterium]|nr:helix-turn-helix transcriptional regulator [Lachnospiraceae bacterium]